MFVYYTIRRIFRSKILLTCLLVFLALAIYFISLQSQGEVTKISLGQMQGNPVVVVPAYKDGAIAWFEAVYVTDVPTNTPIPTLTPTPDKTHKPTHTATPTTKPTRTKGPSPTPTNTLAPSATPTTHAYFIGYREPDHQYDTFGSSNSVGSLSIADHLYIYIADGKQGLQILDTTTYAPPKVTTYQIKEAYAVQIVGNKAYIAAGSDGILVLDLKDPIAPVAIDKRRTIGPAINLDVSSRLQQTKDPATGLDQSYSITRVYVAMGEDGIQILNLSPINTHQEYVNTKKKAVVHKSYTKARWLASEDESLAVIEAHQTAEGEIVIVADGRNGVRILFLPGNTTRPIRAEDVFRRIDIPYAWDIEFGRMLEHRNKNDKEFPWLFVAAGKKGVFTYKVDFGDNANQPIFTPHQPINTPGEARGVTLYHNNIFVGDGEGGVQVIDFNDPEHPKLIGNGRYEFDWKRVPIIYALKEWFGKNVESPGALATVGSIFVDALLCTVSLVLMAFILAGIVLPARSLGERWGVIRRFLANLLNRHGPVWVIEDGRARYHTSPEQRHGMGVTLQDSNSAVLLDQHRDQMDASGAPMTLTRGDEHVIWQAELRRQQLIIGPRGTDPDPFQMRGESEERAEYRARQYRRQTTAGKTSDDIEVVPILRIVYSHQGNEPGEQNEFGYTPEPITKAFQGDYPPAIDTSSEPVKYYKKRQPVAQKLERLVTELWKLMLSRYSLSDLFPLPSVQNPLNVLNAIRTDLADLLVSRQTAIFDSFQDAPNIATLWEDYREIFGGSRDRSQPLSQVSDPGRGIRVHEVSIDAVYLAEADLRGVLWQWYDDWKQTNSLTPSDLEDKSEQDTLICFAEYALQYLKQVPEDQPLTQHLRISLACLLRGTQKALPADSPEFGRLEAVIRRLGGCPHEL